MQSNIDDGFVVTYMSMMCETKTARDTLLFVLFIPQRLKIVVVEESVLRFYWKSTPSTVFVKIYGA